MNVALHVENLAIRDGTGKTLLAPFHLSVEPGCVTSLIGESGAGKSLVCGAIAATLPPDLTVTGEIWVGNRRVCNRPSAARHHLWSQSLFLLPQEPWNALAPARRITAQTADGPRALGASHSSAQATARGLLAQLGLDPNVDGDKRPWQLSGGMAQRAAFAAAMASRAPLVLVDEPTKGLDASLRDRVRDLLRALVDDGRAVVLVTHDLALARAMEGDVVIMQDGQVVERGRTVDVLSRPSHHFTRALLEAAPERWPRRPANQSGQTLIQLDRVGLDAGSSRRVLVRDLSLSLCRGEIIGLSGVSGSGKTTLGDTAIGLRRPRLGHVRWLEGARTAPAAGARQKLYQDPQAAFAPWRPIRATMADALSGAGRARHNVDLLLSPILSRLRLSPELLMRQPGQVSGGELQRLALARLALSQPLVIFADEPTSRLDPLTQRNVVSLLCEMAEDGSAVLLASHDPDLLVAVSDVVVRLGVGDQDPTFVTTRV